MVVIQYKIVEGVNEETDGIMHDTIAALYTLFYNLSSFLSPLIGGLLHDFVNV